MPQQKGQGTDIIRKGQEKHGNYRRRSTAEDKGRTSAQLRMYLIGQASEKRKHKKSQDIVNRHNSAGNGVADVEGVFQNQRDDAVVELPEGADRQKGQTDQNGPFCVKLHR